MPRTRAEDLEGLKLFRTDYPMAKALLLYGGSRRVHDSGIEILPINEFFKDARKWILER